MIINANDDHQMGGIIRPALLNSCLFCIENHEQQID